VVKEMKFRPKIDEHDYATKMRHVERFLQEGPRSSSRSCSVDVK
jgi:translation initiation factor IF-3